MESSVAQAVKVNESFKAMQMPGEAPWGTARKVAFRFAFSYLFLYIFSFSLYILFPPISYDRAGIYETFWRKIVPWVAAHILRLRYAITVFPEEAGGSDTTYDNVKVLCFVLIAALATVVWSVIDRKRIAYSKLNEWTRLYVRVVLASAMLSYEADKVIPLQMPLPSLSTLMQPFGDLTPYRLLCDQAGGA